ncbi:hypothetical protein SARC_03406 [Sphaeroforma arctica JP610]|uniref:DUF547 domain-containing protein n=1 Tax=Sphaeroforma arctica JP610 TaxID=667725 RepID=A0A0L0G674_9EUKA|nr:hypothetical protein SARC_03406 [Sphaeroforma arctica JP610]KNC84361.1 hypothetical protein SARC_03406 [Sphaeroforma arctica JP610]|eukprot:XP_014158263.1 hypothetical protein SARC_03406 [Sphaeroforma arctica JP610]
MLPEPIDKKERSSMQLVCDAKQTYTISFHGMYVDFMKWKGVNFPGMRDVEISSLIGKIALRMVAYTVPRAYEGPHTEALKKYCFCFEMRNNGEDILYPPEDNISVQSSTFSNVYADVVSKPVPKAVMEQRILEMTKRASIMELEEIPNNSITVDCNMYLLGSSANYGVWFVLKVTHEKGQSWAVLRPAESFCELEDLHNRLNKAETASDSAGFTEFRISSFYHSGKRNADCTIPLSEILLCHPCDTNPFEGAFLEVHTLGIVYYIAYSTAAIRDQWMNKIQAQTSAVLAASFSQGSIQLKDDQSMIASLSASARANFGGLQKTHTLGHAHQGSRARIKNKAKRISSSAHDKVLKPIKHVAGRGRDKGSTGDLDKLGKISDSLMTYNSEASMHNTTPILSNNATPEPSEPPSLNGSMSEFEGSSAAIPITGAPTDDTLEVSLHPLPRTPEPIDSPNAARQKCTTKVHSHKLSTASAHLDDSQTVVVSNIAPAMVGRNQRSSSVATAPLESVDENLSSTFLEPENPADMYLVRSKSRWKSNRIILNNRLIYFELLQPLTHPCALISAALLLVLGLNQNSSKSMIVSYLDCVSALKRISLQQLAVMDPSERKAFFLNLYHCIVAHYLLVMGTPSSTRRGISEFYDECSMQVGKNVFSLSEIENGILRAAMTPPKKSMRYNPQKAISNELRQILGAQQVDPRLAMAVNYGTKTCGQSVFIYSDDPDVLDSQLNSAARIFIQRNVMVDTKRNTVTLPKVFEVYSADFGATKLEMLDVLRKYADKYTAQEIGKVCEVMREKDAKFKKGDISWINNLDLREGRLAHLDSSN